MRAQSFSFLFGLWFVSICMSGVVFASEYKPLRIFLVGDSGVGKTSYMNMYNTGVFCGTSTPTIGIDFMLKTVSIDGEPVRIQIWDTAGIERFGAITSSYLRSSDGLLLFFSLSERKSFERLTTYWLDLIDRAKADSSVGMMIVGNKSDLDELRQVSREEAQELASSLGVEYLEVSAKFGDNIEQTVNSLVRSILHRRTIEAVRSTPVGEGGSISPNCCGR